MKILALIMLSVFTYVAEAAQSRHFAVSAIVYSKQDLTLSFEVTGQVDSILQVGDVFEPGALVGSLDRQHELALKRLYHDKQALLQQQLVLRQNQAEYYNNLANSGSVTQQALEDKLQAQWAMKTELKNLDILTLLTDSMVAKKQMFLSFGGVVIAKYANQNEVVAPNTPLIRVLARDSLFVQAKIPVSLVDQLAFEQEVILLPLAKNSQNERALTFDYLAREVDTRTQTIIVSYQIKDQTFRLGQSVRLQINYKLQTAPDMAKAQ
jgi:hypothetical protein